ncbi:MAG: S53 family peptidase, partial [Acidobacteriia bacterium]|nr:S53 family peptidase [Terriglobia bacterium]
MERMILMLSLRPGAAADLDYLIKQQHDPYSALYHQWLSPDQFGAAFGMSDADLNTIVWWLQQHGFTIDEVARGRRWINFTGSVGQVESAFHAEIHRYVVNGELHHANATPPAIPRALADLIVGFASLHDFHKKPFHGPVTAVAPDWTTGSSHYLGPGDFAIIYNSLDLYSRTPAIDGTGQTVAVVARSNINHSDPTAFRSFFKLPAKSPNYILNGTDPGLVGGSLGGEVTEADLDVQWSGAIAYNATVDMVISKSTLSTDGVDLSAQYIANNNLAPIMTTSFGLCERDLGSGNTFYANLWAQAASQGITPFVSSGDSGAAACDSGSSTTGTVRAVNGLCSPPNSVCVGGSQFMDTSNPSLYWSSTNSGATNSSAHSYIPEQAWNESGSVTSGSNLWSTGGGASTVYSKPIWQVAPGVPNDAARDVPDVSLSAAGHDGYLIYQAGGLYAVGGTSAASPSFASLLALVIQQQGGTRQGNANTVFYPMGENQYAGSGAPLVFHDITVANNTVPGVTGYNAGTGFDLATGLGSVNVNNLVLNWG